MAAIGNFQRRGLVPAVLGPRQEFYSVLPSTPRPNPFCFYHLGPPSPLQCRLLQDWLLHNLAASHHIQALTSLHHSLTPRHWPYITHSLLSSPITFFLHVWDRKEGEEASALSSVLWEILSCFFFFFDAGGTQLPRKEIYPSTQMFRCLKSHLWGKGYQIKRK